MAKVFGILLIVLGVWVGIEVYTKGTQQAFGGAFAWFEGKSAATSAPGEQRSTIRRIEDKVRGDIQAGAARSAGQTPEGDLDEGDVMKNDVDDVEE